MTNDPIGYRGGSNNVYEGLSNNTIVRLDPLGLAWSWTGAGLGAGIGGVFGGGVGGALGLLGGPAAPITVPAAAAIGAGVGAFAGGIIGGLTYPNASTVGDNNKFIEIYIPDTCPDTGYFNTSSSVVTEMQRIFNQCVKRGDPKASVHVMFVKLPRSVFATYVVPAANQQQSSKTIKVKMDCLLQTNAKDWHGNSVPEGGTCNPNSVERIRGDLKHVLWAGFLAHEIGWHMIANGGNVLLDGGHPDQSGFIDSTIPVFTDTNKDTASKGTFSGVACNAIRKSMGLP